MSNRTILAAMLAAALSLPLDGALAADPDPGQEPIFGSQLMTNTERIEYRNRMRQATTPEARERGRREHHEQMRTR